MRLFEKQLAPQSKAPDYKNKKVAHKAIVHWVTDVLIMMHNNMECTRDIPVVYSVIEKTKQMPILLISFKM